jgi:hypothetical protein
MNTTIVDTPTPSTSRTNAAFTAIGYWVASALLVWVWLFVLTFGPWELALYRRPYGASFGHHVVNQLSLASAQPRPVCLLVGLSTTRADFDPRVLEERFPHVRFVEAAATGDSILGVDLILAAAEQLRVKPACIVLGLHTHMLQDRSIGLSATGFLDVLSPQVQAEFVPREIAADRTHTFVEAGRRGVWPAFRVAQQIGRLTRDGLFHLQQRWSWREALPRQAFELFPGDLVNFDTFNPPIPARMSAGQLEHFFQRMADERLLDPDHYAKPEHVATLERALKRSLRLSPLVLAVMLPESSYARARVSPLAEQPFASALASVADPRLIVLDQRTRMPDESFDAAFHVIGPSRDKYTAMFAESISLYLDGVALAGQSNAMFLRPFLEAQYSPRRIVGYVQDGSRIRDWAEAGGNWKRLAPNLHQPLKAFVWWQGESDHDNPGRYLKELKAFIARVRREANDPNLLIVICRVVDDPTEGFPEIRQAEEAFVRADGRAVLVSSDGLQLEHPDWLRGSAHLSPDGYTKMAARVVAAIR